MLRFCSLEPGLQLIDAGADAAVDDGVAHGGDDAAEHRRIDDDLQVDLLAGGVGECGSETSLLIGGQCDRGADFGDFQVLRASSRERPGCRRWPADRGVRPEPTTIEISCVVVLVALPPSRSSMIA